MILETGQLDRTLLADLLRICFGIPPKASLTIMEARGFQPGQLGLDDLALALRPGRSVEEILLILTELSAANDAGDEDDAMDEYQGARERSGKAAERSLEISSGRGGRFPLISRSQRFPRGQE